VCSLVHVVPFMMTLTFGRNITPRGRADSEAVAVPVLPPLAVEATTAAPPGQPPEVRRLGQMLAPLPPSPRAQAVPSRSSGPGLRPTKGPGFGAAAVASARLKSAQPLQAREAVATVGGNATDEADVVPSHSRGPALAPAADAQKHAELVQHMWHLFRQQIGGLRQELSDAQIALSVLQRSSERRDAWEEQTSREIVDVREKVEMSNTDWNIATARLAGDIGTRSRVHEEQLQAGLQRLEDQLRKEHEELCDKQEHHRVHLAKLQEGLDESFANHATLQRRLTQTIEEHGARLGTMGHGFERSLSELTAEVQEEIARISNEHHSHIRKQTAVLHSKMEAFDTELRQELATVKTEHADNHLEHHRLLGESSRNLDDKFNEILVEEVRQRNVASEDMQSKFDKRLSTMEASLEKAATMLRLDLGAAAEDQRKATQALRSDVQELRQQFSEAGKDAAEVKGRVQDIMSVPLITRALY